MGSNALHIILLTAAMTWGSAIGAFVMRGVQMRRDAKLMIAIKLLIDAGRYQDAQGVAIDMYLKAGLHD